jgi:hypothetical protein
VRTMSKNALLLVAMLLFVTCAKAQDPGQQQPGQQEPGQQEPGQEPMPPEQPKPAARGLPPISEPETTDEQQNDNWQPDTTPLTGLQNATLGAPNLRHSYWVPGAQYGAYIQSQPINGSSSAQSWYFTNFIGGSLSLLKAWSHSDLVVNYSGGAVLTTENGQSNGTYQLLNVGQSFQLRRWQLLWLDDFSYLPQSQFGFGGATNLGIPGTGGSLMPTGPGLGSFVVPNQSIYSSFGPRYSNAAIVQATYEITSRQSITLSGSAGLLHFTQAGNVDTNDYLGSAGYNYILTPKDTIGVVYRFISFHYPGEPQAFGESTISFAYGRKISRRLALKLFLGPEFVTYRIPIGTSTSQNTVAASASLQYGFEKGSVSLDYIHGLSGGAGVFTGSELDFLTFSGLRRVTRVWTIKGSAGFAKNSTLGEIISGEGNQNYTSWYLGAGVSRPMGRDMNFSFAYSASINQPNVVGCIGVDCNKTTTQNTLIIFLQWHARPFVIE